MAPQAINRAAPPPQLQVPIPVKPDELKEDIRSVLVKRLGREKADASLTALEEQANKLYDILGPLGLDKHTIWQWLSGVIDKQVQNTGMEPSENFNIQLWVKIGRDELKALVNANYNNLGFFRPRNVNDVTKDAFDKLFGNQDGVCDQKDVVSLGRFMEKMRNEVLVFCATTSPNALIKFLQLLRTRHIVLLDKTEMAGYVRTALFNVALSKIEGQYPRPKAGEPDKYSAERKRLEDEVKFYIEGNVDAEGRDIFDVVGIKADTSGRAKELQDLYFKGYEKSVLFSYMRSAAVNSMYSGSRSDQNEILSLAGIATMCGEAGGLIQHLEANGGNASDVYDLFKTDDEIGTERNIDARHALLRGGYIGLGNSFKQVDPQERQNAMRVFISTLFYYGLEGWDGKPPIHPDISYPKHPLNKGFKGLFGYVASFFKAPKPYPGNIGLSAQIKWIGNGAPGAVVDNPIKPNGDLMLVPVKKP